MRQKYIVASQNIPFPFLCLFDYKFQCDQNKCRASHSCHSLTVAMEMPTGQIPCHLCYSRQTALGMGLHRPVSEFTL